QDLLTAAHAGSGPLTVVLGGVGGVEGADGLLGAIPGGKRRYTASEIARMPQRMAANFTQPPTCGIVVHSRTITTPTVIRPISGQSSLVRPISHCPITAPTMICAK